MKAKRYEPQPAKRVYIPKNEHEKRPLGLPALEDKIVQKGIARILEAIYEAVAPIRASGLSRLLVWFSSGAELPPGA